MYFKYGNYQHPDNTVDITTLSCTRMHSPRNRLSFERWTLAVQGHFCVSGQDSIRTQLAEFEAAYRDDWKDVGLYHDDDTKSTHWLSNAASINGVRVVGRSYPTVEAEYASGRSFSLVFQADYLNVEDQIWSFRESVQFLGGTGMDWELVPVFIGPPVLVINSTHTVQKIIQSGSVVGLEAPPLIPTPLLTANYEHNTQRMMYSGSADKIGVHRNLLFPIRYRYVFSSVAPQNFRARADYREFI